MDNKNEEFFGQCNTSELLNLTAEIVAAHASNTEVASADLPQLIQDIYKTLVGINTGTMRARGDLQPAVAIEESVFDDYIICLEDGRKLKMLKRHLRSAYNMTPEQYRERWALPADYPMVAPNYAKRRSSLAMEIGLGRRNKRAA